MRIDWALKAPTVFAQNANAQNTNGGLDAPIKKTLQTVLYQFLQKLTNCLKNVSSNQDKRTRSG
jgi:hypothetical protein